MRNGSQETLDRIRADRSGDRLPTDSERVERRRKLHIEIVVGNPLWSAEQRSSADDYRQSRLREGRAPGGRELRLRRKSGRAAAVAFTSYCFNL